jgi:peptidoglycan/xylan/chitin deacetylase (PgdA/CDA1 family)
MYHRVVPCDVAREGVQAGMYVEPDTFQRHLRFLRDYFSIVPLNELPYASERASRRLSTKPLSVLTFDDGWRDFYTYAFPLLQAHHVPATVFLSTDFIGTENFFWTDRLAFLFHQRGYFKKSDVLGQGGKTSVLNKLLSLKGPMELRVDTAIRLLKNYSNEEIERTITTLSSTWGLSPHPPGRALLSWEEVREMGRSGLITFGSHTASHRILTTLKETEIEQELKKSNQKLLFEKVVDPAFIPFSYPNGNYNERIAVMVRDAGYSLAVTTEDGWNHHGSNFFCLRRVSIHQDMTSTDGMLGSRIVGIF